ncbi:hypothetical protein J3459_013727 [Metarhizium acridum]|nr:hypothetical protein J3459_013727 [Metarhizium acridum]
MDASPSISVHGIDLSMPRNRSFCTISASSIDSSPQRSGQDSPYNANYHDDFRFRTMVTYLHNRAVASGWIPPESVRSQEDCSGVLLRRSRGNYITASQRLNPILLGAVIRLNLNTDLKFKDGSQIQVLDSLALAQPATVKKFQYASVFRQERLILVWHDDLVNIVPQATHIEEKLLAWVWGEGRLPLNILHMPSRAPSTLYDSGMSSPIGTANPGGWHHHAGSPDAVEQQRGCLGEDASMERPESVARPVARASAVFIGCAMCLSLCLLCGVYVGKLVTECILANDWIKMALIFPVPLLMCVSLFFFQVIFTNIFQMIGPIGGVNTNSRHFSAHKPCLRRAYADGFSPTQGHYPDASIQGGHGLGHYSDRAQSCRRPCRITSRTGGSANIFINDDGLRAGLTDDEIRRRKDFYTDNRIGWVARPRHNGDEGFVRKGKFEAYMQELADARLANKETDLITDAEEEEMYQSALARVLEENPLAWADGDIRVGELILIVDSDTRVPEDCLLYGAR